MTVVFSMFQYYCKYDPNNPTYKIIVNSYLRLSLCHLICLFVYCIFLAAIIMVNKDDDDHKHIACKQHLRERIWTQSPVPLLEIFRLWPAGEGTRRSGGGGEVRSNPGFIILQYRQATDRQRTSNNVRF